MTMRARTRMISFVGLVLGVGAACDGAQADPPPPVGDAALAPAAETPTPPAGPLEQRIPPPEGYTRVPVGEGSFGAWLRRLPLKAGRSEVHLYDGSLKRNPRAHVAVVDLDVGGKDLQQCADAVMRLRAEYLFTTSCYDAIAFNFTSGDRARWVDWREGQRPQVSGSRVSWARTAAPDPGYPNLRRYLDTVFTYAGSASLEKELEPVADPTRILPGDVFIKGGFPGHAVTVVDVAEDGSGARIFLVAQSYMPAQEIHVLRSYEAMSPWYPAKGEGPLATPEWAFDYKDLKRFPAAPCEQGEAPPAP